MADPGNRFAVLAEKLKLRQAQGDVAELVIDEVGETIEVRPVGDGWLDKMLSEYAGHKVNRKPPNSQAYYFLSEQLRPEPLPELRPGSGVIRVSGGRSEGPGGTLTCFLSTKDGRHDYFVAAGHVLSNFWDTDDLAGIGRGEGPTASIYRLQKGFPATNSTRFLGKLTYLSPPLRTVHRRRPAEKVIMDIGIVKLRGAVEPVQRTTCYGSFGEWTKEYPPYEKTPEGLQVMKCGAEETHWTYAVVESSCQQVTVYGPGGLLYTLDEQVILGLVDRESFSTTTDPPPGWSARKSKISQTSFAIPGDSGTMVVDRERRRPVGMLIAGSVLDGRYVMTPFKTIQDFWQRPEYDLVLRRG